MRVILHIFHCACAIRPYFYFRSKICHYYRVPRPWFPTRHGNFGDARTFKADIGLLIFAWIFRTSWPKMGWGKLGKWVVRCWPQRTLFLLLRFLSLCQFWWKSIKKCDRESAHRRTGYTNTLTIQTGFYLR